MKLSPLLLLLLSGTMAANAALTVVSGNVYDVGKYSYIQRIVGATDDAMCWAAAAANVIQHWQDTYISLADEGESVPNGTTDTTATYPRGSGELDVYNAILDGWYPGSGVPYNVISWWMQGPTPGGLGSRYNGVGAGLKDQFSSGGYYQTLFGSGAGYMPIYPNLDNAPFYSLQIDKFRNQDINPHIGDVCTTLKEAFKVQGQAVSLLVHPNAGGSGHAITCWGYEEDANGNITSLILSDSDDRKFGAFMVNLAEGSGESAIIQTDRYNSWYHGDYTIKDVVYITTPTEKAITRGAQTPIADLESDVLHSGQLTKAVDTSNHVTIGGGTYDSGADEAVVFTTAMNASISISDGDYFSDGALLTVADGGMALLYGGLSLKGGGSEINSVRGAEVVGHLYIHGGDVTIENCSTDDRGGAAMQGGVLPPAPRTVTDGLYATSYIEVKNAGAVKIQNNHSNTEYASSVTECFGGGAVSAEDSFSFRDNKSVAINSNSIQGYFVYGGGAFAHMEATLSGNDELEMSNNEVLASSCIAEGGALAAMFTNICENKSVLFAGNLAQADDCGDYMYVDPATGVYIRGAHASGGAVAVSFPSAVANDDGDYIPAELHMDRNVGINFSSNTAKATLSDHPSNKANASGGALYVGNLLQNGKAPLGAQTTISNNTGEIIFSGNKAVANSYREAQYGGEANGIARGGAIAVAQNASLTIDGNKGGVSFSNNSAVGSEVSQGGGIYNEGNLQITNNGAVEFSDNTAAEGSHLYNAMGATAEIAWNDSVLFSGETAENSTVVNKGTMYLAAGQGKTIEFHNTTLDTTEGMLYLGKDAAGNEHATTLSFTGNAAATNVSSLSEFPAELSGLSLSLNSISSKLGEMVSVDNLNVSTDTDLVVNGLVLGSNVQLAETNKEHALTLSNVVVDLGNTKYTVQENERGGTNYIFDLQSMLSGNITLSGITFDASDLLSSPDFLNKDSVCMMFGDVEFTQKDGTPITLSYVGQGGTSIQPYKLIDGSNVYFGEYFEVPEPATGTLSLLALTLLAARRRRK